MQNTPDGYFYYTITVLLAGAIVWIVLRYVNKMDKIVERLDESVSRLITITEKHEQKHDYQDEKHQTATDRINRLESRMDNMPTVTYPKVKPRG